MKIVEHHPEPVEPTFDLVGLSARDMSVLSAILGRTMGEMDLYSPLAPYKNGANVRCYSDPDSTPTLQVVFL